jgi:DNA-directed RNA polymerase specialized sigma24 family protein
MLIDTPGFRGRLFGLVNRLAPPPLREDLMQEALVHLWRAEEQDPGRDEFWYLQGCRFHLQNFLRQGRSVDAFKRFGAEVFDPAAGMEGPAHFEPSGPGHSLSEAEEASSNDFVRVLEQWLTPVEKETFRCLLDGLSAREIANQMGLSHTMVNRHRSRIGELAAKLGLGRTRATRRAGALSRNPGD